MLYMYRLDSLDARIILALDDDPSATILALAGLLRVARNTVHARLRRLTDSPVLRPFSRRLDPRSLGYDLTAFVELSIRQGTGEEALAGLSKIPEIIEIHSTTGNADILLRVVARDTTDLHRITNLMLTMPGVLRTNTSISLLEVMPLRLTELLRRAAEDGSP
ncbi:Lrp/AsnC family transcriptional regulator [Arthrobacter sp. 2RAF6]|uniref:Lrp/AsnC family transcriptional regulator n=1 Tax=Arthrobacter sp. 2RAF6 TaxID=3233002 RepID=UPI003F90A90C